MAHTSDSLKYCLTPDGYLAIGPNAEGTPVRGLTKVDLKLRPNGLLKAEVSVILDAVDVIAHPLLSLETVRESAKAHGFDLVEREDNDQ